jgi:glycosyltransferase involved in cell wall biosynthesis
MRRIREWVEGIEILRYPQRAASGLAGYLVEYLPSMTFSLAWLLWTRLRGRVDVVHGCNPPDLFWIHGLIGKVWGARYVFDQHDANPELAETKWGDAGSRAKTLLTVTRWLERRSYATADLVIAPNDSYRRLAIERGRVKPSRVVVVRNAPDSERYRALAEGITPEPHSVGYVGVMGSQDGLDTLLDAWRIVMWEPDMSNAVLHLIGDGEARPALERQAVALEIASAVVFHGYLQSSEFIPILARCAIGVAPDRPTPFNSVSTMVKVIDYLAIGRGVVTFDLAETRLAAGAAAFVAASPDADGLAEAMLSVMRDPALARSLGASCDARIEALNLDWRYSAAALVAGYESLTS